MLEITDPPDKKTQYKSTKKELKESTLPNSFFEATITVIPK
jgi:hypothetical protein